MALWTPADTTTSLWLDASDAATITEVGGSVSAWADKSGNGNDYSALSGSNEAALVAAELNGMDVVRGDGVATALKNSTGPIVSGAADRSVFFVAKHGGTGSGDGLVTLGYDNAITAGTMFSITPETAVRVRSGSRVFDTAASTAAFNILGVISTNGNTSGVDAWIAGTALGVSSTASRILNTTGDSTLFYKDGASVEYAAGDLAEVVVFSSALGASDRQRMEGYLAWKWGLEADLPPGHPYELAPPETSDVPTIDTQPTDQTVTQGETATFTAVVSNADTLQWFENGEFMLGENAATLEVEATLLKDGNTYQLRATNAEGSALSDEVTLTVGPASVIAPVLQGPADVTVGEGGTAVFNVTAFGVGPFTYQWRVAGGAFVPGATDRVLSFTAYRQNNGAAYEVIVTDVSGLVTTSRAAILTVVESERLSPGSADVDYPCSLPGVLTANNSYASRPRTRRNDLASGPPLFMLEDDGGYEMFDVAWSFSAGQVQVFRNWYRCDTVSGSKAFNIPLMVDGAARRGGPQTLEHECYFDGVPQYTQQGRRWRVSATLIALAEKGVDCCDNLPELSDGFGGNLKGAIGAFDDIFPPDPPSPPVLLPEECQPYSCSALEDKFSIVFPGGVLDQPETQATVPASVAGYDVGSSVGTTWGTSLIGKWTATDIDFCGTKELIRTSLGAGTAFLIDTGNPGWGQSVSMVIKSNGLADGTQVIMFDQYRRYTRNGGADETIVDARCFFDFGASLFNCSIGSDVGAGSEPSGSLTGSTLTSGYHVITAQITAVRFVDQGADMWNIETDIAFTIDNTDQVTLTSVQTVSSTEAPGVAADQSGLSSFQMGRNGTIQYVAFAVDTGHSGLWTALARNFSNYTPPSYCQALM